MRKRILYGLLVGLGAALIALCLWYGKVLDGWERTTWSWRVRAFAKHAQASPKIKMILVDQESLDWGKRENQWSWPWPRQVVAAVLDFCHRGGAKAVAFDVLYTEPSVYGVEDDKILGKAVKDGAPFSAAVFVGENSEFKQWPDDISAKPPIIQGLDGWMKIGSWKPDSTASFPIPEVRSSGAILGNITSLPDADGIYRRNNWFRVFDGRVLPSLGLASYLAGQERAGKPAHLSIEPGWFHVDDTAIPIDGRGRSLIRFVEPTGTHESYSAAAVIQSEIQLQQGSAPTLNPSALKDCYVFFGYSAPGLYDLQPTPVADKYPGVEIHATMLDNLLSLQSKSFLRETPNGAVVPVVALLAVLAGIGGTLSRRAWHSLVGFVVFLTIPFLLGYAAYDRGFWWPIMACEVAVGLSLVGAMVVNYATEGRQKAFLKSAFRHYLGAEIIEQIIADPGKLTLGGEKRELTIFFSDIEKFSSFSERLDPPTLTALLNDYLSDMSAIIQQEGGYLDKYIGDAIVAFWNAPLDQPDHAARACRAAVRCSRALAERRPEFQQRTGAIVKARIGMNTGLVAVGNMGSYERFNYTILGDAANLASRLEGANKAFGTYSLISETTWEQSGGNFVGRELGRLRVVGRKAPVRVYELAGLPGEGRPAYFAPFEEALTLFYAGHFAEALLRFEKIDDDAASKSYTAQCRMLMEHPPVEWDGVLSLTEK